MATKKAAQTVQTKITVKKKLQMLSRIQRIDSEIDEIEHIKGELPEEIKRTEEIINDLRTRIATISSDIEELNGMIQANKAANEKLKEQIKKHESDKDHIKNDRELISLENEIEADTLDISINEKRSKAFSAQIKEKKKIIDETLEEIKGREKDLAEKQDELHMIENERVDEVKALESEREKLCAEFPDKKLLDNYTCIRKKDTRNGLAVVPVIREACGGCFNHIPPQRRIDIIEAKNIINCEYCGRILVSESIDEECENAPETK